VVFLTGCPTASESDAPGNIAGIIVEGIEAGGECRVPANADDLVGRVIELVNRERAAQGLAAVAVNPVLTRMADDYACELIEDHFFAHISPSGRGPAQRAIEAGYVFLAVGENLAGGQASPEQVMHEWLTSPQGHRENILQSQWKEIGISVRTGGDFGVYWVQVFGNPP
jgi:uncharacterized protein YkwD